MPTTDSYSAAQKRLHWAAAILILVQFVVHDPIKAAFDAVERGGAPDTTALVALHIVGGLLVLAVALWRIALRRRRGAPAAPGGPLIRRAAAAGHWALYALMVLTPASGAAAWFGRSEAAAEAHEVLRALLLALIAGHIAAALWHHFALKDGLLLRMR